MPARISKRKRDVQRALAEIGGRATTRQIALMLGWNVNGTAQTLGTTPDIILVQSGKKAGDQEWELSDPLSLSLAQRKRCLLTKNMENVTTRGDQMEASAAIPNPPNDQQIDNIVLITIQNFCNSYQRLKGARISEIMSWLGLVQKDRNHHRNSTPAGLTDQDWDKAITNITEKLVQNNIPLMYVFSDIVVSNAIQRLYNQQKIRKANRQQKPNKIRWKTTQTNVNPVSPEGRLVKEQQKTNKLTISPKTKRLGIRTAIDAAEPVANTDDQILWEQICATYSKQQLKNIVFTVLSRCSKRERKYLTAEDIANQFEAYKPNRNGSWPVHGIYHVLSQALWIKTSSRSNLYSTVRFFDSLGNPHWGISTRKCKKTAPVIQ